MTLFYILLIAALVALAFWAIERARRIKAAAAAREDQMLAAMAAVRAEGADAQALDLDRVFDRPDAGKTVRRPLASRATQPARPDALTLPGRSTAVPPSASAGMTQPGAYQRPSNRSETVPARPQIDEVEHFRREPANNYEPEPVKRRLETRPMPLPASSQAAGEPRKPSPVRDLVLTWYEARGYRPIPALPGERPIEFVFRHKADPLRAYAFAALHETLTRERALALLQVARAAQAPRLLLACEQPVDAQLAAALARDGVRALDPSGIERELASTDGEAAQRIRTLAQRRGQVEAAGSGAVAQ